MPDLKNIRMRKVSQYSIMVVSLLSVMFLLQGCPSKKMEVDTLASATKGTWEWVKTTTSTRTWTPQSVGYSKQLAVLTDDRGAYVAFYKNDTLQRRLDETSRDTNHTFVDTERSTVLIKYGGAGYIKYLIANTGSSTTLAVSEVLNPYSSQADTIHSIYARMSKSLYPY